MPVFFIPIHPHLRPNGGVFLAFSTIIPVHRRPLFVSIDSYKYVAVCFNEK